MGKKSRTSTKIKTTTATSKTKDDRKFKTDKPSTTKNSSNKSSGIVWSKAKKKRMRRLKAQGKFRFDNVDNSNNDNKNVKKETMNDVTMSNKKCQKTSDNTMTENDDKSDSNILRLSSDIGNNNNNNNNNKRSALQQAYLEKLSGSRFRDLNEELYTTTSDESLKRFRETPELFDQYHKGFRTQVQSWPVNPVDVIRHSLIKLSHQKRQEQNKKFTTLTIVDFGCGDATLAKELLKLNPQQQQQQQQSSSDDDDDDKTNKKKRGNNKKNNKPPLFKVHSLDLVSNGNDLITPCDMSHTPLPSKSIDVGVFCLALMGTNISDFIREAHRLLKSRGLLKIAEVRSRFESTRKKNRGGGGGGGVVVDTSLLDDFVTFMTTKMGFEMRSIDRSNKMFFLMDFVKREEKIPDRNATFTARPCIYKRR